MRQEVTQKTEREAANQVNHETSSSTSASLDNVVVPVTNVLTARDELNQLADVSYLMAELTSDVHQRDTSPYSILSPYFMRAHGTLCKAAANLTCAIERSKAR